MRNQTLIKFILIYLFGCITLFIPAYNFLYAKDPYEAKYRLLINKRESTGLDHFNDSKAFIEYSNHVDDIYKNTEEYNPDKKT